MTAGRWLALLLAAAVAALATTALRRRARRNAGSFAARFFAQPGTAAGVALGLLLVLLALFAPWIAPYPPALQLDIVRLQNRPPGLAHPLGTDVFGRDVWSRVVFGARVSLGVGALAALLAAAIGALVGAAAGAGGRRTDAVLMRLVDVGLAVPRIFIVLAVIAVGRSLGAAGLAVLLGLTGWFQVSRLIRAEVLSLAGLPFVEAARALGVKPWRVVLRHLLPNTIATLTVALALGAANAMLLEAGLSFLGVGVQPPIPSWGNMIADARDQLTAAPWSSLAPGLAITAAVAACYAIADGFRAAWTRPSGV